MWVLGEDARCPKLSAFVVTKPSTTQGTGNYIDVVAQAVDTVEGARMGDPEIPPNRLQPASNAFIGDAAHDFSQVQNAESVANVLNAMGDLGFPWQNADIEDVLRDVLTKPEGSTGYPFGDCYWNGGWRPLRPLRRPTSRLTRSSTAR